MTNTRSRTEILAALVPWNLFQPATALWRVYEIEAIDRHARFAGRVLDLGCGDGSLATVVFRNSPGISELVGVEPDPSDAADAARSGRYVRVHTASGGAIPEPNAAFDSVFSNSVLEHIPDLEPVLAEVARIIRRRGTFVFTVPSEDFHRCLGPPGVVERALAPAGETVASRIDRRLAHHRYFTPSDWAAALSRVGLELRHVHRYFPEAAVHAWQRISARTSGVVFELLGRRSATRAAQRRLRLPLLEAVLPAPIRSAVVRAVLRRHLDVPADSQPSGGLLVVAERL